MKKNKKKKKLSLYWKIVIALLLIILFFMGMLFWTFFDAGVRILPEDQIDPNADQVSIAQKEQRDKDVFNVLLVGSDSLDPAAERGRSDSMMLVSFNKKEGTATMVSFLRDSLVEIMGHGRTRLGHAYAYGGVGLTVNTINTNYDLDIQNFVTINIDNLSGIIDELGGIEVYISAEEAELYQAYGMKDIVEGTQTLSGSHALMHARNRELGSDFERTRRQRDVMYGIYNKVMQKKDPATIMPLIEYCMTQVSTNMRVADIYEWATIVLSTENLETQQAAIPCDGTYQGINYEGMDVLEIDFEANKEYLKELLY